MNKPKLLTKRLKF